MTIVDHCCALLSCATHEPTNDKGAAVDSVFIAIIVLAVFLAVLLFMRLLVCCSTCVQKVHCIRIVAWWRTMDRLYHAIITAE
jgi:hypothetical protein